MRAWVALLMASNLAGLLLFGFYRLYTTTVAPAVVAVRYSALDRAQVINEERLSEAFPELAKNSRHLVPNWIIEPVAEKDRLIAVFGLVLASFNLAGIAILSRRARTSRTKPGPLAD